MMNVHKSCSITGVEPKTVFEPYSDPKNSQLGPQKGKNDPQIKSISNVRIKGNIANESCCTIWVDPKTIFETDPNPQNVPFGPKKLKIP